MPDDRGKSHEGRPSFDQLYTQYFDFVWRIVRRLGVQPSLVEDAAQDTFIVVHRKLDKLRPDASPKAFVFAIAQRVAHDYRRSARRKGASNIDDAELSAPDSCPHDLLAQTRAGRLVERFLASLSAEQRAVFVLTELEGMTAPEMAEVLTVNVSTIYTRIRAARQRFEEFLAAQEDRDG